MMLSFAHALPLQKQENPQVYRLVENVAIAAGLPMPKVYIVDDESLNAFATGRDPKHASIALTTGIIANWSRWSGRGYCPRNGAYRQSGYSAQYDDYYRAQRVCLFGGDDWQKFKIFYLKQQRQRKIQNLTLSDNAGIVSI